MEVLQVDLLKGYLAKYPDGNLEIARMSPLYHNDVNLKNKVDFVARTISWGQIVERLNQAIRDPGRKFIRPKKNDQNIKRNMDSNAGRKRKRS